MKITRIISLLLALLMTLCCFAGCKEEPEELSSYYTYTSEITEEGEDLVVGGDTTTDATSQVTSNTDKNANTGTNTDTTNGGTVGNGDSNGGSLISSTPKVEKNEYDAKATMPKIDIKGEKISVCIDWDPKSSWVQKWEKAFKKAYPGIKVTYKQATPEMKASKLAVWANSNQSPDLVYVKPEESWPDLVNKNIVEPVDKYIDINSDFWGSIKGTMDSLKINGKYYALVSGVELYGNVIYSKKVMDDANLTDPEILLYNNQWTWSKFKEYARRLTKINSTDPKKSTYGVHLRYGEVFIPSTGKDLIEYSGGNWKSNLEDNNIKNAIEFIRDLGPTGSKYTITEETDPTTLRKMTVAGQIGMYVTAEAPGLEFPDEMKKGTLKYVPIPKADSANKYYSGAVVDAFYVPKGAKNPQGGVAYACAVRGFNIGIVDIKTEKEYTEAQKKILDYALSKVTAVPLQFRRLSGTVEYYDIYGPTYYSGESYSGIVAECEPKIKEALKKQ